MNVPTAKINFLILGLDRSSLWWSLCCCDSQSFHWRKRSKTCSFSRSQTLVSQVKPRVQPGVKSKNVRCKGRYKLYSLFLRQWDILNYFFLRGTYFFISRNLAIYITIFHMYWEADSYIFPLCEIEIFNFPWLIPHSQMQHYFCPNLYGCAPRGPRVVKKSHLSFYK